MVECPECNGSGTLLGVVVACGPQGSTVTNLRGCGFCQGKGSVEPEQVEWRTEGQRLRQERQAKKLSLRQAAGAMNFTAQELSQMETGRIRPYTLKVGLT